MKGKKGEAGGGEEKPTAAAPAARGERERDLKRDKVAF